MNLIGNILWIVFGGFLTSLFYLVGGLLLCLTIVGIPFGGEVVPRENPVGCLAILMNVLWIILGGIEVALAHLSVGVVLCCTIIGIPFGLQHFKLMIYALLPFGHKAIYR